MMLDVINFNAIFCTNALQVLLFDLHFYDADLFGGVVEFIKIII